MQKNVMYLFLFVLLTGSLFLNGVEKPPVADILLTGNLQGRPSKTLLSYIHAHNPYSIWVIGGNALDGKKAMEQNKGTEHGTYLKADRSFLRSLYFANPCLAVPGNEDFLYGLHGCVASFRALRPAGAYVLDYIGARNNENPFLLKYVDILVNGKTLRFMALGAWEKLYPAQKDVPDRRITEEVIREMGEYAKKLKKVDFTILITVQSLKYDMELAGSKKAKELFDLIISNDPSAPLFLENKGGVPVAGSGKHAAELRKIYFNPVADGVGGARIQVWKDGDYAAYFEKIKNTTHTNKKKIQEKKKK